MEKTYELKIYNKSGAFIKTVEQENIISQVNFSGSINSGNSEVVVEMKYNAETLELSEGQVMKMIVFSDNYPTGKTIFTGICTISEYRASPDGEYQKMTYIGVQYWLSKLFYKSGGNYTATLSATPGQIIKDVIDFLNTTVGYSWLDTTNIDITGSSMSIDINHTYCMSLIKSAIENKSGYYFFIDGAGLVYFRQKSATADHLLTLGGDVDNIVRKRDIEDIMNSHIVEWSGGTRPENSDMTSQNSYFKSQLKESKTDLKDTSTADAYSNSLLTSKKNPIYHTSVSVNINFIDGDNVSDGGLEELLPGHTVTILNTNDTIENLQIHKISYNIRGVELELEAIQTLGFLLSN